jgi:hypothetical protein
LIRLVQAAEVEAVARRVAVRLAVEQPAAVRLVAVEPVAVRLVAVEPVAVRPVAVPPAAALLVVARRVEMADSAISKRA